MYSLQGHSTYMNTSKAPLNRESSLKTHVSRLLEMVSSLLLSHEKLRSTNTKLFLNQEVPVTKAVVNEREWL